MNNVNGMDCRECFHRKMCNRKIEVCDFVDETKIEIGLTLYEAYYKSIVRGMLETHIPLGKLNEEDAKRWL